MEFADYEYFDNQPVPYGAAMEAPGSSISLNKNHALIGSVGATVSVTPGARMKIYGVPTVPQQTRHARRIYVGGIPPNFIDEDGIRIFFNNVIAQGLGEENDSSYVLSVYINQKKCFAFIELKSIELAAAYLELDGIIMKNVVLRILRANEYKPELIPSSMNKAVRFNVSGFQFGTINQSIVQQSDDEINDRSCDSIIQYSNLQNLDVGSTILVGYPYDDTPKRPGLLKNLGCTNGPKSLRYGFRKFKYGSVDNPEFGQDLSKLKVIDIGDVLIGKCPEETKNNLSTTISELVSRGTVPFIVGGSNELIYPCLHGLLNAEGGNIIHIMISAHGDIKILDDPRFCPLPVNGSTIHPTCNGKLVLFGAQGSQYSREESQLIQDRGAKIVWYTRDLRNHCNETAVDQFAQLLKSLKTFGENTPIALSLDMGSLHCGYSPLSGSNNSPQGFTLDEITEMTRLAASESNLSLFTLTEFVPPHDDVNSRSGLIFADIFYNFLIGSASRPCNTFRAQRANSFSNKRTLDPNPIPSPSPSTFLMNNSLMGVSPGSKQDDFLVQQLKSKFQVELPNYLSSPDVADTLSQFPSPPTPTSIPASLPSVSVPSIVSSPTLSANNNMRIPGRSSYETKPPLSGSINDLNLLRSAAGHSNVSFRKGSTPDYPYNNMQNGLDLTNYQMMRNQTINNQHPPMNNNNVHPMEQRVSMNRSGSQNSRGSGSSLSLTSKSSLSQMQSQYNSSGSFSLGSRGPTESFHYSPSHDELHPFDEIVDLNDITYPKSMMSHSFHFNKGNNHNISNYSIDSNQGMYPGPYPPAL